MKSVKLSDLEISIAKIQLGPDDILLVGIPDDQKYTEQDVQSFTDQIRDWFKEARILNHVLIVTAVNGVAVFDENDMAANGWIRKP